MIDKTYKSITEVSILLNINKHVIRYWDSKFEGISTRLGNKKRRFFNSDNINKLKLIKDTLYSDGKHNYSLGLVNKILSKNNVSKKIFEKSDKKTNIEDLKEISKNLKKIINSLN